jgi:hypothetical protein
MTKAGSPERWMKELVGAATEVAHAMGLGPLRAMGSTIPPGDVTGIYLPIVGQGGAAAYVAWLAPRAGCEAIAKKVFGDLITGPLSQAEVFDALGEVMNIVAGSVKRRMRLADATLALGLPIVAETPLVALGGRILATRVVCGGVEAILVFIGNVGAQAMEADPLPRGLADG